MLYNNEIKSKYIQNKGRAYGNVATTYFTQTKSVEEEKGKDIALFTNEEWFEFLFSIDVITIHNVNRYTEFFKTYAKWYSVNMKTEEQNYFDKIGKDQMIFYTTNIINKDNYIPRDLFVKLVNDIPNAVDRYVLLCIYEGIKGEDFSDIILLKQSDIDRENNIFHLHSGKDVVVSDELMQAAIAACSQKNFVTLKSPFDPKTPATGTLDNVEYVFRVRDNASYNAPKSRNMYRKFASYKSYFENSEINAPRLLSSGFIAKLHEIMEKYDADQPKQVYDTQELKDAVSNLYGEGVDARRVVSRLKNNGYTIG